MIKKLLVLAITTATLSIGFIATAADKGPHDSAIKGRQAMMHTYSFNLGILGAMAKEKMGYDADLASESAANLLAAANFGQSAMWPEGSDNTNPANARTRALPEIWSTYPAVVEKGDALKKAAAVLAEQAGGGLGALQGAMGDVGSSCKGCHDDFRAEKK